MTEPAEIAGRIVIAWPKTVRAGIPLPSGAMQYYDYDTGQQLLGVTGLKMVIDHAQGYHAPICAELTELVDEDGRPHRGIPFAATPHPDDPSRVLTGVFRYHVLGMRDGPLPTRESRPEWTTEDGAVFEPPR